MGEKIKVTVVDVVLGLLKKAPELGALIVVVLLFLQAQEKRDTLLRDVVGELKIMTQEIKREFIEIHSHLDFVVEKHRSSN